MDYLTRNDLLLIEEKLNRLGFYPTYDLPIEKLPLCLLMQLCDKVSDQDKALTSLNNRVVKLEDQVRRLEEALLEYNVINDAGVLINEDDTCQSCGPDTG